MCPGLDELSVRHCSPVAGPTWICVALYGLESLPDLCRPCLPQKVYVIRHHVTWFLFDTLVPKLLFRVLARTLPESSVCPLGT